MSACRKPAGNHLFSYAISHDGGDTFGPISLHPDLPTPVCMSALFAHESGALLFSGPFSQTVTADPSCSHCCCCSCSSSFCYDGSFSEGTTEIQRRLVRLQARENLTVLASLDNGRSFTLSLSITTGPSGYSALQCGLPGRLDCAILYDGMGGAGLLFSRFAFADLKPFKSDDTAAAHGGGRVRAADAAAHGGGERVRAADAAAVQIGSRKQLLVDRSLLAECVGAAITLQPLTQADEAVLTPDAPCESSAQPSAPSRP